MQSMDSSDLSDGPITLQEYLEVKKALATSDAKVQQLMKVNNNLSEELRRLQREVRKAYYIFFQTIVVSFPRTLVRFSTR